MTRPGIFFVLFCFAFSLATFDNATGDHLLRNDAGAQVGLLLGQPQMLNVSKQKEHQLIIGGLIRRFPLYKALSNLERFSVIDVGFRPVNRTPNYFSPIGLDNATFDIAILCVVATFEVTQDGDYAPVVRLPDYRLERPCNEDKCFLCEGNGTECVDCKGVAFGEKVNDLCGVCDGANECLDCRGLIDGDWKVDACGICGGDNSTCM